MENEKKKYSKSAALARMVRCYPPPKYHRLFEGYRVMNEMKVSEAATQMIREFFDRMPAIEREKYIRVSKNSY